MLERVFIAGSGGQGVILVGKILAARAMDAVPHVTFFPAYGAEVRGGTSNCQVILSSEEIASPVPEVFDSAILMNQESYDGLKPRIETGGLFVINRSLCRPPPDVGAVPVDATDIANELGDVRVANFIMLGAYLARKPVVPPPDIEAGIRQGLAGKSAALIDLNLRAFREGLNRVRP